MHCLITDLNLLDWSTSNILAVALGTAIYLWNATTCTISQLLNMQSENDYITGLSWTPEGGILAVGTNAGAVQVQPGLWSVMTFSYLFPILPLWLCMSHILF